MALGRNENKWKWKIEWNEMKTETGLNKRNGTGKWKGWKLKGNYY